MPLNNVYYWDNDSWKKITAEEFVKHNPQARISANEKYFWCESCGQYVTLANGNIKKAYFKHSSSESEKDCEDRAKIVAQNDWINSSKPSHDLPLKICVEEKKGEFYFQIGLIQLPPHLFDQVVQCQITIECSGNRLVCTDLADHLLNDRTTWIRMQNLPLELCSLKLTPEITEIDFYWTDKFQGINQQGTLFDSVTGRKILNDADVKIDTKYYLLTTNIITKSVAGMDIKCLFYKQHDNLRWFLYEVEANELSEKTAKFFLDYHCRLTAKPISIQPFYPIYAQTDDNIYCDSPKMFFYCSGTAKINFFPPAKNSCLLKKNKVKLIAVEINERQQMIASGRLQLLQYLYLWKNWPNFKSESPEVKVKDGNETMIASGVYHILPKNSLLQVYAEFDIRVIVSENHCIKKKLFVKAGEYNYIFDINWNTEIKILQGLDCIWSVIYERNEKTISQSDQELFLKLERGKGKFIQIPHTWGSFVEKLKKYPKVKNWLYKSIRSGFVREESYFLFKHFILNF